MCVKGRKGGQTVRRNSSLHTRLVITLLSGCAVLWWPAGRAPLQPAARWLQTPRRLLELRSQWSTAWSWRVQINMLHRGNVAPGVPAHVVGPDPLCSLSARGLALEVGSAGLTEQGKMQQSLSCAFSASPCQLGSSWGRQVPMTIPKERGVLGGCSKLPPASHQCHRGTPGVVSWAGIPTPLLRCSVQHLICLFMPLTHVLFYH